MRSSERPDELGKKLQDIPRRPGVYLFLDGAGRKIYIGKAKSLRSRVRSYFQPSAQHPPRIARMVAEVRDFELIVVDTELEALILESNLVKRERPRFNVLLRDDKHFPYIKLSLSDPYPRASLVRQARLDGNLYTGPFLPAAAARRSLKLVQRFFRVPTCTEIFDGKRRPCLYHHLDQCLAPCAGLTNPEEYATAVDDVRLFLEGRHTDLEQSLRSRMQDASEARSYEAAARHRDALRTVQGLAVRQRMSSAGLEEQDFLSHHTDGENFALQLFQMRQGKVQSRRQFTLQNPGLELDALYATVLAQMYSDLDPPPEIYVEALPERTDLLRAWLGSRRGGAVQIKVPQRGGKRRFLDLVRRNAALAFEARFRSSHVHGVEGLEELARALDLDEPPYRIECFDISNLHGTDSVASMVLWEGGKPKRSGYRSFNIRGVKGPDDYASIAEAVTRRYRRLLEEERRLPDLVLIDGGVGQLGSAVSALTRVGLPMLAVASIAKREEEIFVPGRGESIRLDLSSPALQLVQRIRDEAHRFAVDRHRKRRSKRTLKTGLTDVPGIGPIVARKLLRRFGSLDAVKRADREALQEAVGPRLAERLLKWFTEPPG